MDDPTVPHATEVRPVESRRRAAGERFLPGEILGNRYRVVSLLGRGGMGEVYRADDLKLGQSVALKHLPLRLAGNAAALERLYEEVRIGRLVSHPNVCRIYDIAEAAGEHFIAMEFVDGEDLASLLRRIGRLPGDKALAVTRDLCAGLAAAHERGFVHRDLKPANVMIDGRGSARIMDFGLAALSHDLERARDGAGTPAYMAPEQLTGAPATVLSDIYALGLILFELFTGRRVFEAATAGELRAQHTTTKTRPSAIVADIDPAIERLILRCIDEDPAARPASVYAVMAALPGADPLLAAVAAGETPSPGMVAAAGAAGDISPLFGWALTIVVVAGVILGAALADLTSLPAMLGEVRSRDALSDRARSIVRAFGYENPPADREGWYSTDAAHLRHAAKTAAQHRWKTLAAASPSPLLFRYRQSDTLMVPANPSSRIRVDDPAPIQPGMTTVLLDHEGRLLEFERVPPLLAAPGGAYDWQPALREAGLDPATFRPVTPQWTPRVGSDRQYAWTDGRRRVEAASRGGKPVSFRMIRPWTAAPPQPVDASRSVFALITAIFQVAAAIFAYRNYRRGRADLRGAVRATIAAFVLYAIARVSVAHHTADPGAQYQLLAAALGESLYNSSLCWIAYLGFEPYVRRRWPHILISWSRLLKGRWKDALVARDMLIGLAGGVTAFASWKLVGAAALYTGGVLPLNTIGGIAANSRVGLVYLATNSLAFAGISALATLVFLLLFRAVTPSDGAAWVLLAVLLTVVGAVSLPVTSLSIWSYSACLPPAIVSVYMLRRWGVVALTAVAATMRLMVFAPLTLESGQPYSPIAFTVCAALAVAAFAAFRGALAGKPMFGSAAFEDQPAA